jgi:hypothetical protein
VSHTRSAMGMKLERGWREGRGGLPAGRGDPQLPCLWNRYNERNSQNARDLSINPTTTWTGRKTHRASARGSPFRMGMGRLAQRRIGGDKEYRLVSAFSDGISHRGTEFTERFFPFPSTRQPC